MCSLVLSGGGNASETNVINNIFVQMINHRKPLLYIPVAGDPNHRSYERSFEYIKSIFQPLGVSKFDMWTEVQNKTVEDVTPFSAIYISGGDAKRLWRILQQNHFDTVLYEYLKNGGIIYGQSAGAMIFGKEILDGGIHEGESYPSLNLVQSHSLHCHYIEDEERSLQKVVNGTDKSVVALPNGAALLVTPEEIKVLGEMPAYIFDKNGKREF